MSRPIPLMEATPTDQGIDKPLAFLSVPAARFLPESTRAVVCVDIGGHRVNAQVWLALCLPGADPHNID